MMAVDTSALMAIVLNEATAETCMSLLAAEPHLLISAATVSEALIVADRRNVGREMALLIEGLEFDVKSVTSTTARSVVDTYRRWGKGVHPAALNFGDCFSYAVALEHDCALLCVGNDFARTDLSTLP